MRLPRCRGQMQSLSAAGDQGDARTVMVGIAIRRRLVVHAVTQETEMIMIDCWKRYGGELVATIGGASGTDWSVSRLATGPSRGAVECGLKDAEYRSFHRSRPWCGGPLDNPRRTADRVFSSVCLCRYLCRRWRSRHIVRRVRA